MKTKSLYEELEEIKNSTISNKQKLFKFKKVYEKVDKAEELICGDPMNGCPEDFAESFDREKREVLSYWFDVCKTKGEKDEVIGHMEQYFP